LRTLRRQNGHQYTRIVMRSQGIIGAALMAVGGLSPLVHVPIVGNWNYFDLDMRLAVAFYMSW
jgi:hypothetical protein